MQYVKGKKDGKIKVGSLAELVDYLWPNKNLLDKVDTKKLI
jgi:hypothetical protein